MPLTPDEISQYYDKWTRNYMASFGDCFQAHRPADDNDFLSYVAGRVGLTAELQVLDAGCGICGPARFFAKHSGVIIEALTISRVQAQIAQENNAAEGLTEKINVSVGDFHDLVSIYGGNRFDRVYFLESLSHSPEPERVIRSVYDVLRPGGFVYIKDFFVRVCESAPMQQRVLEIVSRVNQAFCVETPWAADIVQRLTSSGFERDFVETPQFESDLSRWFAFENAHKFNLYHGEPMIWSDWLELRFRKPLA